VPKRYLSVREAQVLTGLSDKTFRRRIADGTLTAYRCGPRLIKLDLDEVQAMMQPATKPNDVDSIVAKIVAAWPPLSVEQRDRIASILRGDRQAAVKALDGGGDNGA
jgi:excisionase family DNA binding protein